MKKVSKKIYRNAQKALDASISNRVLVLAIIILVMFGILGIRLIYLQGFAHDSYLQKKDDYTSIKQYTSAPRGQIYDCKGNVLAKTVVSHNIVYTSPNNLTVKDYLVYADRVGTVFEISLDDFSEQELKEAYLTYCVMLDPSDEKYNGLHLLSEADRKAYLNGDWGADAQTKLYARQMKALKDVDLYKELDPNDLKTYAIYNRMLANQASGQESVILEDVSDTDVAYLVEHKTEFPGFDVDFGGWKREYPYGEHLSDVIGTVSTSTEGLPLELKDFYQSKGFQLNSQVGKSGLELQYNDLLSGTEEITKITYDSNGLAQKEIIQEAKKGYDIYLSIDMDLQVTMDDVLKQTLAQYGGTSRRENFHSLYMCMMDPNTGDMLALSGYQQDPETRDLTYFASGNYRSNVNPGSSIKGVTVYMGQSEGVVQEGEFINDAVMNIGGEQFASFSDHGPVNDIEALAVSSNVYMFNIAIRLGGGQYVEGEPLKIDDVQGTLDKMRNYYSMFGLGNKTGIDAPGEV
ncbi:MAG: penicillin-binding protein 2, partial [Ileibacterium sp.]|nr:penicillin-binding protein 2 [Ileibacterium sp.]